MHSVPNDPTPPEGFEHYGWDCHTCGAIEPGADVPSCHHHDTTFRIFIRTADFEATERAAGYNRKATHRTVPWPFGPEIEAVR